MTESRVPVQKKDGLVDMVNRSRALECDRLLSFLGTELRYVEVSVGRLDFRAVLDCCARIRATVEDLEDTAKGGV